MRSSVVFAIGVALSAGCSLDWEKLYPVDASHPPIDTGTDAQVADVVEASSSDACGVPKLVINELRADGAGGSSDELVEIKNVGACTVELAGWTLQYSSAAGSAPFPIWTGTVSDSIAGGAYATIGGQAFTGTVIGRIANPVGSLSKSGGGVGLFAPSTSIAMDSVAYQALTTTTHPFVRPASGVGAPNPPSGQSIARTPDGVTTDDNAKDFIVAASTPNAPN